MKIFLYVLKLIAISLISANLYSQTELEKNFDKLIDECEKLKIFSGTMLVSCDGEIVYERSSGYSDHDKKIMNNSDTKYNIGSIGKLFTSVMILQLLEEGKLNLDAVVSEYLPGFSSKVTVRQLLRHRSGYGDYLRNPEYRKDKERFKEIPEILKLISGEKLLFEPGEKFSYSNSGYVILGGLIEKLTGKSYQQNMSERILIPLSMKGSGYIYWDDEDPEKATGYIVDIKGNIKDNRDLRLQPSPAGGMYSTVKDLFKLEHSLVKDNLILKDESKLLLFGNFDANPEFELGKILNDPDGENVYAGGAPGINALLMQFTGKKYTVVILSNYDLGAETIESAVNDIIQGRKFNIPALPAGRYLYNIMKEKGKDYVEKNFDEVLNSGGYNIENDMMLNNAGYQFLNNDMPEESIIIFRKNVQMFPEIANCYDSLADAYLANGDKENAAASYRKILELNPGDEDAKNKLEQLK